MQLLPSFATENSLFKAVGDIFHPLFKAVAYVLAFIYGIVPNYALAIVILTVIIMALLTPLTIKSTRSMLAMQKLQPELQKLRQKYKGAENREQLNQEMMRLYRENNVSPTGGCLPMFLQMPALIVLYDTIKGLANTISSGTKFPTKTLLPLTTAIQATGRSATQLASHVVAGTSNLVNVTGMTCMEKVHGCAVPRYIPATSTMYKDVVKTPGVLMSFGLNLAAKPLTHRTHWYEYVPYFALVIVAVGLQYFQMAQMTRRNRGSQQQVPQQMQTMQRVMPLIFAYIYFLVPAGVVIYMIVSSAIRVLTQDLIFRYGIVEAPGARKIGATPSRVPRLGRGAAPIPAASSVSPGKGDKAPPPPSGNGSGGAKPPVTRPRQGTGGQPQQARRRPSGGARGQGSGQANGQANGSTEPVPKTHPRSKSKRARKAR